MNKCKTEKHCLTIDCCDIVLLNIKCFNIIDFFQILINFIILIQYRSHDKNKLCYLNHVLNELIFIKKYFDICVQITNFF